jgi:hypothetical protein
VEQSVEELVGGGHEAALVEGDEGDDVAIGRRRRIFIARNKPLHHLGPSAEEAFLHQPLHARVKDVGTWPQLHGRTGRRHGSVDGGAKGKRGKSDLDARGEGARQEKDEEKGGREPLYLSMQNGARN